MHQPKPKIVQAQYVESFHERYQGNPLIEALPEFIDEDDLYELLTVKKVLPKNLSAISRGNVLTIIEELKFCHFPTVKSNQIYEQIYLHLHDCYVGRSPNDPDMRRLINSVSKKLKSKYSFVTSNPAEYVAVAPSILVSGEPGAGKTVAIRRLLDTFPQVILHHTYKGQPFKQAQILYLSFDMKSTKSKKALSTIFFNELERILGTEVRAEWKRAGGSTVGRQYAMQSACLFYNIGIIHIDEFQYLLNQKKNKDDTTLPELEALFNKIGIPVILSTTSEGLDKFIKSSEYLKKDDALLQTVRRITSAADIRFNYWNGQLKQFNSFFDTYFPEAIFDKTVVRENEFKKSFLILTVGLPDGMSILARAFLQNWHKKVNKAKSEVEVAKIDHIKLLENVYTVRLKGWHNILNELRANYHVGDFGDSTSGSNVANTAVFEEIKTGKKDNDSWVKRKKTSLHHLKPSEEIVRIEEGEEVIDAERVVITYDQRRKGNVT